MAVQLRDSDGTVRLAGDLLATGGATGDVLTQQADGTYAPAVGGSQPVTRARYGSLAPITIAASDGADITWAKVSGTSLLDLTAPALPTIVDAGVYAVLVSVSPNTDFAEDGWFSATLDLDVSGDPSLSTVSVTAHATAGTSGNYPIAVLGRTWYLPAGAQIRVSLINRDAGEQEFEMNNNSTIQRLSS